MQQSRNPSQGPNSSSDQPGRLSSFPTNHKNPCDQPGQVYSPSPRFTSIYQSSVDISERTSLLTQADATLTIDKQLSSGWYACYKYWLYFLAFPSIINFLYQVHNLSASPYIILKIIRCLLEVAYAVVMTDVLKNKSLEKAVLGFKLALSDFLLLICQIMALVFEMRGHFDKKTSDDTDRDFLSSICVFICLSLGFLLYCGLGVIIPAWKIKGLIEKRRAILQKDISLYEF